jgi:putative PEP-CTERM system TPR-repeat lipoprotein
MARGYLSESEVAFSSALAIDPKYLPALYFRGNVFVARGNSDAAKKDFERILAQTPTNMSAYMRLTQIAFDNGRDREALAVLDRAMKAAPTDPAPRLSLANYQIRRGNLKDGQETVAAVLKISPTNQEGLALQGQIQLLKRDKEAINTFRVLAAHAASPAAYDLLAKALYSIRDQLGAEDAAKRAIELAPHSSDTRKTLIDIQIGFQKEADALATARQYTSTDPGPTADLLLAETLARLNRMTEAEAVLDKSIGSKPDARVALRLSALAIASGNPKKSLAVLANWVSKNPNDFGMRRQYAAYLMRTGDLVNARKEYEFLIKRRPEDPIVLNDLGWLIQKDDPNRALSMLSLAANIAPRSAEIVDKLGWLKYQRQDRQGALINLQRAHDIDTNSASISYHLALALDANGKRAEAKTLLQATLEKNPKFDGSDDARGVLAQW